MVSGPLARAQASRALALSRLLALFVFVSLLAGCSKSNSNGGGNAQLRILNAFSEAPAINVTVASNTVASGLPFQGLTQYTGTSALIESLSRK